MGLTGPVTWFILGSLIIALIVLITAGIKWGAITGGVLLLTVLPVISKRQGLTGYERSLMAIQFFSAFRRKEHIYRGGLFSEMPGGKAHLPGVLAPTKMYEGEDSAGYRFGMIHMPKKNQYTVVLRAWPQGDEAVDRVLVNQWVGEWGVVLASAGLTSDIEAIVPVLDTVPETGNALLNQARLITAPHAPALAKAVVYEGATEFHRDEVQLAARVAITFAATTDERKKDPGVQAVEIGRRLPGIRAAIEASGVAVRSMSAAEITGVVRRSFDPASQQIVERAEARGE
ncbi:SCO6880 family protein, partial [Rhodococcus sp. T7]